IDFTFVVNTENRIVFPGYHHPIVFPVLGSLRVTNATGVYDNIYGYFTSNTLSKLVVKDDPDAFEHIDWCVLQNAQRFEIEHPTGEFYKHEYSSDSIQKLFAQESTVREVVMLGPVYYILPRTINWHNLILLDIAVAIADKDMLGNMVAQLPHLESLHINCVSMFTKDACDTVYPDQKTVPEGLEVTIDEEYAEENPYRALSWRLRLLDIYADKAFDVDG
ncbi:hypothetical protein EC988_006097, partial [Linderina pennispora]